MSTPELGYKNPYFANSFFFLDANGSPIQQAHLASNRRRRWGGSPSALPPQEPRHLRKRKGFVVSKIKSARKDSSPSISMTPSARELHQRGACARGKNPVQVDALQDLALPLGMSFAAVLSQVWGSKIVSRDRLPAEHLSMVCTSAVKESVSNIYGNRFDCFIRNFEKSFDSTLKTLRIINKTSNSCQRNRLREERPLNVEGDKLICEPFHDEHGNSSRSSLESTGCEIELSSYSLEPHSRDEQLREHQTFRSVNQLALCRQFNQQLVHASHNRITPGFNESMLTTFEKSVMEQTRSNDLKEVEIGLNRRRLQLKQSQLSMNFYANVLGRIKVCMNMSKATFKEEKLRNQIKDTRHAELIRRCIDLLVSGLILMCAFLIYGASIFSHQRITEATSSCMAISRESKSWWMPKPMASFSSSWQMLRCHAVVITRMLFGLLMILIVAYSLFQRSVVSGSTMPVTFIVLLLGIGCGFAGKLFVDTLGGSGYCWLIYWEAVCFLHLFANIFPSILHRVLYGCVSVTQVEKAVGIPYWIRRYTFYSILLLVLPIMAGLLPFASLIDWKEHFTEKLVLLIPRADYEV